MPARPGRRRRCPEPRRGARPPAPGVPPLQSGSGVHAPMQWRPARARRWPPASREAFTGQGEWRTGTYHGTTCDMVLLLYCSPQEYHGRYRHGAARAPRARGARGRRAQRVGRAVHEEQRGRQQHAAVHALLQGRQVAPRPLLDVQVQGVQAVRRRRGDGSVAAAGPAAAAVAAALRSDGQEGRRGLRPLRAVVHRRARGGALQARRRRPCEGSRRRAPLTRHPPPCACAASASAARAASAGPRTRPRRARRRRRHGRRRRPRRRRRRAGRRRDPATSRTACPSTATPSAS